jgi:polysaccharide biosynthesis transport protein
MTPMTLRDYARLLREGWIIVLSITLAGVILGGVYFWLAPAKFTSNLTMYVSAQTGDTPQGAYQGAQLSQQRVTSYVELVRSPRITTTVARRLQLDESSAELASKITASSALDSVLIDVTVTDKSSETAARIANEVGNAMTELVAELERPATIAGTPPVQIRVVQPATAPESPSSSGLVSVIALGALVGLLVGLVAAIVRNTLDRSIRSSEQVRVITNSPMLGSVAFDESVSKNPLTMSDDPRSPRAEAYRQLRTNLQFVDIDNPHRIIVITSSVPGEGKTTTAANLAVALSATNARVLLVDADLRKPRVDEIFGLERSVGLTTVLSGQVSLNHAIQSWGGRLDILTSGSQPPNPSELLGSNNMRKMLDDLRSRYDVVLIDTPPLLPVTDAAVVTPNTDGVILVVRVNKTTRQQLQMAVDNLGAVSAVHLGSVISMAPTSGPRSYGYYGAYYGSTPSHSVRPPTSLQ